MHEDFEHYEYLCGLYKEKSMGWYNNGWMQHRDALEQLHERTQNQKQKEKMAKEKIEYLVISQPDGSYPHIETISKEELQKRVNEEYWGKRPYWETLPKFGDGCFYQEGVIILKVEKVIVPKPVNVVTSYSVD
jgi:hypothetical protein